MASGQGCKRTFSCPYHGWTYNLDGSLRGVPGEEAFPDLEKETAGLKELFAIERGGLVYVQQEGTPRLETLDTALDFFEPSQPLIHQSDTLDEANWKLLTETLLEGYHIKSLHRESFYPFGLDNVNVVESFGQNSRVIYPFKRIEKLRSLYRVMSERSRDLQPSFTTCFQTSAFRCYQSIRVSLSLNRYHPLAPRCSPITSSTRPKTGLKSVMKRPCETLILSISPVRKKIVRPPETYKKPLQRPLIRI